MCGVGRPGPSPIGCCPRAREEGTGAKTSPSCCLMIVTLTPPPGHQVLSDSPHLTTAAHCSAAMLDTVTGRRAVTRPLLVREEHHHHQEQQQPQPQAESDEEEEMDLDHWWSDGGPVQHRQGDEALEDQGRRLKVRWAGGFNGWRGWQQIPQIAVGICRHSVPRCYGLQSSRAVMQDGPSFFSSGQTFCDKWVNVKQERWDHPGDQPGLRELWRMCASRQEPPSIV